VLLFARQHFRNIGRVSDLDAERSQLVRRLQLRRDAGVDSIESPEDAADCVSFLDVDSVENQQCL
jgi:hypothetical protein